ncbi:MAG: ATP-binding protein DrrA1-3 family domain-containing protein [Candidatus Hodarchaeales archaeon]
MKFAIQVGDILSNESVANRNLARGSIHEIRGRFVSSVYIIQAKNTDIKELEKLEHVITVQTQVDNNGKVIVEVDDMELGPLSLIQYLASKKVIVSRFSLEEPTLEKGSLNGSNYLSTSLFPFHCFVA